MSLLKRLLQGCSGLLFSPTVFQTVAGPVLCLRDFRRHGKMLRPAALRSILVVRVDEIGDFVMTTPFLRELRRNVPEAWITLVVKPGVMNLAETCPYVNEVLVFNPDSRYAVRWFRLARAWRLAVTRLWRRRFDTALLPRWDADVGHATYVAYLSGAPVRVGYSETVSEFRRAENTGYDRLLSKALPDATLKHEVEHNLDVLRAVGGTVENNRFEIWLKPEDESLAERALSRLQNELTGPFVAFGLGCRASHKQWPVERFGEVARWLVDTEQARLIALPGPREESLAEQWRSQLNSSAVEVIKNTSLRQAAAILKRCQLFVGNDSSLKHLAVAMGVPCVEIFNFPPSQSPDATQGTPASRFHAWGVPYRTATPLEPRPPCTTSCKATEPHCILGISVSDVQKAIHELLAECRRTSQPV